MNYEYIFHETKEAKLVLQNWCSLENQVLNTIALMEESETRPKVIDLTSVYQSCAMEYVRSKAPLYRRD
jgi:hypothetical protein